MTTPVLEKHTTCPICSGTRIVSEDIPLNIQRCATCQHVYTILNESPLEQYDEAYFQKRHKNWFENPNTELFGEIFDALTKNCRRRDFLLMDIGCGNGDFLQYMASHNENLRLYGLDIITNQYPGITFFQGDLFTYPFQDQYDVVTAIALIEHVPDPQGFLKKLHTITIPGGLVVLNTVNRDGLLYQVANIFRRLGWRGPYEHLYDHHHLQHFSLATLRILLEQNGFRIIRQKAHNFPLKAVDVPRGNPLLAKVYLAAVALLFTVTRLGGGVHQTVICTKN